MLATRPSSTRSGRDTELMWEYTSYQYSAALRG